MSDVWCPSCLRFEPHELRVEAAERIRSLDAQLADATAKLAQMTGRYEMAQQVLAEERAGRATSQKEAESIVLRMAQELAEERCGREEADRRVETLLGELNVLRLAVRAAGPGT